MLDELLASRKLHQGVTRDELEEAIAKIEGGASEDEESPENGDSREDEDSADEDTPAEPRDADSRPKGGENPAAGVSNEDESGREGANSPEDEDRADDSLGAGE